VRERKEKERQRQMSALWGWLARAKDEERRMEPE
jgi:hypothetical protein